MKKRYACLAAAALAMGASPAAAQNVSVSMQVPAVFTMSLGGSVTLADANVSAFDAQYQQSSTDVTVTHKGNVRYKVQVAGPASKTTFDWAKHANRTAYADTDPSKPLSHLLLSTDGFTTPGIALGTSGSPATLIDQTAATGSTTAAVKTRLTLGDYATPPGVYSTTVTFTIVEY